MASGRVPNTSITVFITLIFCLFSNSLLSPQERSSSCGVGLVLVDFCFHYFLLHRPYSLCCIISPLRGCCFNSVKIIKFFYYSLFCQFFHVHSPVLVLFISGLCFCAFITHLPESPPWRVNIPQLLRLSMMFLT